MKRNLFTPIVTILCLTIEMAAPTALFCSGAVKTKESAPAGLQQRIDFGNAHIMGQSIKSGAVYLMHRKKSNIDSMLKVRQDYRKEILKEHGLEDTALTQSENSGKQGEKNE